MKTLIVDDDPISRLILQKMLVKAGYEIITAEDGLKAWEIFREQDINLIISDWIMPNMDGISLCRKVREAKNNAYVYFIIMTARDRKEDFIEVFKAGADDFISKPLDADEVKARIMTGERILKLEKDHNELKDILIESKNKIVTVFDALEEEIISVDTDFKIISANRTLLREMNVSFNEVIGSNILDLCAQREVPDCNRNIASTIRGTFESQKSVTSLHNLKDSNNEIRHKQMTFIPVISNNRAVQVVISCRDITEELKKSEKINRLNIELEEALLQNKYKNDELEETLLKLKGTQSQMLQSEKMSSIGQLAAGVAHEINNPTGFVSSNLKTLGDYQTDLMSLIQKYRDLLSAVSDTDENTSDSRINNLRKIIIKMEEEIDIDYILDDISDLINESRDGANRIKKIVQDLKDFAHPGEDELQLANINKNIESTLNVAWNEIKYKATVEKDYGDLPDIVCYPHQLNQVFMNLLVNAAQAIEKNGEIKIITRSNKDHVNIVISDNGPGIPKENISKIFDPFFTTKEIGKGTGLGLNVAYNIIKKHRGTIKVDSETGRGTTFMITLPLEQE